MPTICTNDPLIRVAKDDEIPYVCHNRYFVVKNNKVQNGFTLVELVITLVIGAVLFGIAIPNLKEFILNSRIVSQSNDVLADIATARSEAIKRSYPVVLCPSSNPAATTPACDGAAGVWETGWLMFQDTDASGTYAAASTDVLLRIHGPIENQNTLRSLTTLSPLVYRASGVTAVTGQNYFRLCDTRGSVHGRAIVLETGGRAHVSRISSIGGATCP